jgi:hypothetical protein
MSSAELLPAPPTPFRRLVAFILKICVAAGIAAGALDLFRTPTVLLVVQRAIGVGALVILCFAFAASCSLWVRGFRKYKSTRRVIRRALWLISAILLTTSVAAWLMKPAPWLVAAFALSFCAVGRLRRRMNRKVRSLAKEIDKFTECDTLPTRTRPFWRISVRPAPHAYGSSPYYLILRVPITPPLGRRLNELHGDDAPPLRRSNKLVASITLVGCALCITGGAGAYFGRIVFPLRPPAPPKANSSSRSAGGTSSGGTMTTKARTGPDPTPPEETRPSRTMWSSVCPSLPELGSPDWAKKELNSLYLGEPTLHANPPPGTEGGCTGRAIVPAWSHERFVYTVGLVGKRELRSVAVDSSLGPAIFLVPAARRVLSLIEETEGPVGGLPTIPAGNGDVTSITTAEGSYALVRAEEHQPGHPDIASPYVELPPLVATAWISAMGEQRRWLWPQQPRGTKRQETFALTLDPLGGESRVSIVYDPGTHTAMRNSILYRLPTNELNEAELKHFAELAGP